MNDSLGKNKITLHFGSTNSNDPALLKLSKLKFEISDQTREKNHAIIDCVEAFSTANDNTEEKIEESWKSMKRAHLVTRLAGEYRIISGTLNSTLEGSDSVSGPWSVLIELFDDSFKLYLIGDPYSEINMIGAKRGPASVVGTTTTEA
ncbi:hypothetical protein MHM98_07545 [Psychrobium sp. MM17-31]|uniref:hypothetical protein n=1 Tax=Psychrobium sp. MM17-31 TaxID=2917758 RepID=UPI001EF69F8C|nr:hypothetical protein [Psychrobium sp. MM17-31]MCG7531206.1 hypothetical protein [Psychrobium sp. MM17-31]